MKKRKWPEMPMLLRFLALHAAWGMSLGALFALGIIWSDFLGLGALLAQDRSGVATAVLIFQSALTFGAVGMGVAVMNLAEPDD